jgi:hypothetical protein
MSTTSGLRPAAPRSRLRTVLIFCGALLFLFEEWLWTRFLHLFAWLGRLGMLRWLDSKLVRLAPAAALVILCIPIVVLFPVKIVGLWMITTGRLFSGCCVMLTAKLLSTAIIARIFVTCRSQLLRMAWFARLHAITCALRDRVHRWMEQQPAWIDARRFLRRLRARLRGLRPSADGDRTRHGILRRWRSRRRAAVVANLARTSADDERR